MRKKSQISRYTFNTSGNFGVMAAILVPLVLSVVGAGISMQDVTSRKSDLQNHADHMSLMIAKLKHDHSRSREARQAFVEYRSASLRDGERCYHTISQTNAGATTATVNCTGSVPTFLPKFTSLASLPYTVHSASTTSSKAFEIAFVFDISDSMVGDEMKELQTTLDEFTESVLFDHPNSRLSLIPFANTVRLDDRFEQFVDRSTGYAVTNGVYTGCFDREATDPTIDIKKTSGYPLVNHEIASGREVCPSEDMTAIFHKTASDKEVTKLSGNIELAFGTGMSDGLVWGYRSLDPNYRGLLSDESRYPLDNTPETEKHLIMMTDGRPYDRPYTGPGGGSVTQQISLDRFETVCSQLEFIKQGINFHLINFNNNKLTNEQVDIYETCVKGEGKYYEANSGELSGIISQILDQASELRVTK